MFQNNSITKCCKHTFLLDIQTENWLGGRQCDSKVFIIVDRQQITIVVGVRDDKRH